MTGFGADASRWQQVKRLLEQALSVRSAERDGFLERACDGDHSLRAEVESLLRQEDGESLVSDIARQAAAALELRRTANHCGERLGPWRLAERLGEGGMGTVYRAERDDREFSMQVAVKVIRQRVATRGGLERFRKERQILADIDHPNVARLIDAGTTADGLPYFVMEYVEGEPFDRYCDNRRLTLVERLELFREVCAAVGLAHRVHVVHRDLKPSNILVTGEGVAKLLDFGIAKLLSSAPADQPIELTAECHRVLTPAFASPEQIRGRRVTPASDVYSLGVLLYLILSGHRPYDVGVGTLSDAAQVVCKTDPPAPSVAAKRTEFGTYGDPEQGVVTPEEVSSARRTDPEALCSALESGLDSIVLKALAKDPADRFQTAEALSAAIAAFLSAFDAGASGASGADVALKVESAATETGDGRPGAEAPAAGLPNRWGNLLIRRKIGGGRFGEVFECHDPSIDRTMALKLCRIPAQSDDLSREIAGSLLREGKLLARIRHPNVVCVHGAAVHDDRVGLWMEYVEGHTLETILAERGRFGAREATGIGIDLCSALAAAHAEGVLHRDIKAENVLRQEGGRIVLTDFGSGRDLASTLEIAELGIAGTPLYIAPEVLQGRPASVQSDLYSLGALLYRLVTGSVPVPAGSFQELVDKQSRREFRPVRDVRPDLPRRLVRVIDRAVEADPRDRFRSAGHMQRALERAVDVHPDGPPVSSWRLLTKPDVALAAAIVVMLATLALAVAWLIGGDSPPLITDGRPRTLLVAGFDNNTSVAGMDDEIEDTLSAQLDQSRHFDVTPLRRVRGVLDEMGLIDTSVRIDFETAREVCLRAGIPVLVTGSVDVSGTRYVLRTELWDVAAERMIDSETASFAAAGDAMAAAIDSLAAAIRERTGEALPSIAASNHSAELWTSSVMEAQELYSRALTEHNDGGMVAATALLRDAVALDPGFAMAHAMLGRVHDALGDRSSALTSIHHAIDNLDRLTPKEQGFVQSFLYAAIDEPETSASILAPLVAMYPYDAELLKNLGQDYYHLGDYERAISLLQRSLAQDPRSTVVLASLSNAHLLSGDYARSREQLRRMAAVDPDATRLFYGRGYLGLLTGDRELAFDSLSAYSRVDDPLYRSRGISHLAKAYGLYGRYDDAVRELERQLAFDATLGDTYFDAGVRILLATIAHERDDRVAFQAHVDAAADLPLAPGELAALGSLLARDGQLLAAERVLERLNGGPREARVLRLATELEGEIVLARGDVATAIAQFRIARNHASYPPWSEPLARALAGDGQHQAALEQYGEILARTATAYMYESWGPSLWAHALYRTARLHEALGNADHAIAIYRRYLTIRDDADEIPEVRDARDRYEKLRGDQPAS